MTELLFKLENAEGLHARPAGMLAKTASQFQSKIEIHARGQAKNAKSIMSLLSLGLEKGDEVRLVADGADEQAALESLRGLVDRQFAEG